MDNAAVDPDIENIYLVEHAGTSTPGFDWDVYAQFHSQYGSYRAVVHTSSAAGTWIPDGTLNVTAPGSPGNTILAATLNGDLLTNSVNQAMVGTAILASHQFNVNATDGTNTGFIIGGASGSGIVQFNGVTQVQLSVNGSDFFRCFGSECQAIQPLYGGNALFNEYLPNTIYSVAGTPLPSCASATKGGRLVVSDATVATPGSAYVGSGTYTIGVECVYNSTGSVYSWNID